MIVVSKFAKKIFGSRNQRLLKKLGETVKKVNSLEPLYEKLSDIDLRNKTVEFKDRFAKGETLDSLLVEAFAVVREASKRTLSIRHFDVQIIGAIVLHRRKIAEMYTGEGKTLVSTMPAYLNALTGRGVHIITVNDYLAKRDANWMGPIYEFLGLTVGVNLPHTSSEEKRAAYAADIIYGTNNEFGFDYLRDNMAFNLEGKVQRDLHYAIIDEVDSILIDESRTPLIISGPSEDNPDIYRKINKLIPELVKREDENGPGDYYLDEKMKQVYLTEDGHQHVEELMIQAGLIKSSDSLYNVQNISLMHYLNAALRANTLFSVDVDYIVRDGEVIIVDEHTGRTMQGRRWSDGLHQAVEAKEGVKIQNENQTLATITLQNYFRLYEKLSGMTGTADTEAYEFQQIYGLEVVVIPPNRPLIRKDYTDRVFLTSKEKYSAIVNEIKDCVSRGQPTLVGTASIEASEYLSSLLAKNKIKHQILNAKHHEKEAQIIVEAGRPGCVTIATNMAGRGTDIVLGGNLDAEIKAIKNVTPEKIEALKADWHNRHDLVLKSGGLHVLGSERHESRRIDNQLRGRSGRQGDPGSSRFYVSLEDNLMRIFAADRMSSIMRRWGGVKDGEAIEHKWVMGAIENAQRKVEGYHFDIRKQLLEFDNVANDQRKVFYKQRNDLLKSEDISNTVNSIMKDVVGHVVELYVAEDSLEEEWDITGLVNHLKGELNIDLDLVKIVDSDSTIDCNGLKKIVLDALVNVYKSKEEIVGADAMSQFQRSVMINMLDLHWRDHLSMMDHLRHGIHLSGYAQKNPKQEYKRESFILFSNMLEDIKYGFVKILATVEVKDKEEIEAVEENRRQNENVLYEHKSIIENESVEDKELDVPKTVRRDSRKIGRNEICPCGSGKKYKRCCGKLD